VSASPDRRRVAPSGDQIEIAFGDQSAVVVEFGGGLFIVFGFLTRLAAVLIIVEMIGAIVLVNWKNGFFWTKGGMEFPLTLIVIALVLVISGPSPFSIDRATGIESSTT